MPLNLQKNLPAIELLKKEHIFVMDSLRASEQDIRPLRVVVLNLMPLKITTETDLVRLLSNTPLQVELDFMKIKGHTPKIGRRSRRYSIGPVRMLPPRSISAGRRKRGYTISMGCLNMICRPRCSVSSVIRSGNRLFRSSGGSMTSSSCLIAVIPRFAERIS